MGEERRVALSWQDVWAHGLCSCQCLGCGEGGLTLLHPDRGGQLLLCGWGGLGPCTSFLRLLPALSSALWGGWSSWSVSELVACVFIALRLSRTAGASGSAPRGHRVLPACQRWAGWAGSCAGSRSCGWFLTSLPVTAVANCLQGAASGPPVRFKKLKFGSREIEQWVQIFTMYIAAPGSRSDL